MVLVRPHVGVLQVAAHGVLYRARRGADVAVVEIDDVAVDAEGGADLAPEVLIARDFFRCAGAGGGGGGAHAVERMALKCGGPGKVEQMAAIHLEIDYSMRRSTIRWGD